MDIREAMQFIESVSWLGSRPGLERTYTLLGALGNPQKKLRFIHIAGTNGKGSTASMLASILQCAGFRTGLYTSPYLYRFNERMQINGEPIPDETLARLTERVRPHALAMTDAPTEFEIITALAMEYFAEERCDIVVLETGLGGRLDSTNVIDAPECAVLTNIGLDHVKELGDTVEKIAAEKAAIIKPGSAAVVYGQRESVLDVFRARCAEVGAPMRIAFGEDALSVKNDKDGQIFTYEGPEYALPLLGRHQLNNAAVALETVNALRERGWSIPEEAVKAGLARVQWPARFEIVHRAPYFVVDGGHNPQCAETVLRNLQTYFPGQKAVFLMGVLRDKDYPALTDILAPCAARFVTVTPDSPRALPAEEFAAFLRERYGLSAESCSSIEEGTARALALAEETGLACSVGSLYMSGPIRHWFGLC